MHKYESMSFLGKISTYSLHKVFEELSKPFQVDSRSNVIDYNWHVDTILKNA